MERAEILPVALLVVGLALPGTAFAACQERGGLICGSGAPRIESSDGLQVSRGGSYGPLASGAALGKGDRVVTGATQATLTLGASCSAVVGAGALVSISRSGGNTCASVMQSPGAPMPIGPETTGAVDVPGSNGLPLGAGAGLPPVAVGAGVAAGTALAVGLGVSLSGDQRNFATPAAVSAR